jgi:hypothetical protein
MLDFTWKIFSQTGNIDTYLLFKELEREKKENLNDDEQTLTQADLSVF